MKERPILFSGPMVRAILEGRKTQTRRALNPRPHFWEAGHCWYPRMPFHGGRDPKVGLHYANEPHFRRGVAVDFCPYGKSGDRLWVRETWSPDARNFYPHRQMTYRATDGWADGASEGCRKLAESDRVGSWEHAPIEGCACAFRWHPSIHMPREASRLTLEVTGVRVEQLQEVSEEDALAEGVTSIGSGLFDTDLPAQIDQAPYVSAREGFMHLWDSINGKRGFGPNPWVWVIEFKRVCQ